MYCWCTTAPSTFDVLMFQLTSWNCVVCSIRFWQWCVHLIKGHFLLRMSNLFVRLMRFVRVWLMVALSCMRLTVCIALWQPAHFVLRMPSGHVTSVAAHLEMSRRCDMDLFEHICVYFGYLWRRVGWTERIITPMSIWIRWADLHRVTAMHG